MKTKVNMGLHDVEGLESCLKSAVEILAPEKPQQTSHTPKVINYTHTPV